MNGTHRVDVRQPLGGWDPLLAGWPQVAKALAEARARRGQEPHPRPEVVPHRPAVSAYRPRRSAAPVISAVHRDSGLCRCRSCVMARHPSSSSSD
jgi:hypothetical protein